MYQLCDRGNGAKDFVNLAQFISMLVSGAGLDNRGLLEYDSAHGAFLLFLVFSMTSQANDTLDRGKSPYFFHLNSTILFINYELLRV